MCMSLTNDHSDCLLKNVTGLVFYAAASNTKEFECVESCNYMIQYFMLDFGIVFVLWLQYIYWHHVLFACQKMRKICSDLPARLLEEYLEK